MRVCVCVLYEDLHCEEGADVLSGRWCVVKDQGSYCLPVDENGRVSPFLVRLRLLNYVYDLPSKLFCFNTETREVIRLSVPEQPLPPDLHLQHQAAAEAADEASDAPKRKGPFANIPGPLRARILPSNDASGYDGFRGVGRRQRAGGGGPLGDSSLRRLRRRDWFIPSALPRPRSSVYLLWRTSAFASTSGNPRHDLFLSSCVSVRNTTELSLAVIPTVPGPTDERTSVFAAFRKKFAVQPSKPPTSSMPPFVRGLEALKQQERRSKRRQNTHEHMQQQQPLRTFPPVLKLPAMEHYIVEDPTSTDIGRKFSMVADCPSSDEDAAAAAAPAAAAAASVPAATGTAVGAAANPSAAAAPTGSSNPAQAHGRVKFAVEGLLQNRQQQLQQQLQQQQLQQLLHSRAQRDKASKARHTRHTDSSVPLQTPDAAEDPPPALPTSADAAAAEGAAAEGAAAGGGEGTEAAVESAWVDSEASPAFIDEKEKGPGAAGAPGGPWSKSPRSPREEDSLLPVAVVKERRRHRQRVGRELGNVGRDRVGSRSQGRRRRRSHERPQEKVPLTLGVDYIVLDGSQQQLLPLPLFWQLTDNTPLWCCLADRIPKYKHKIRKFVLNPKNADFLAEVSANI